MKKKNSIKYYALGIETLNADKLSDALNLFSQAIALDPQYSAAYQCRSEVLARLGRKDEADADIQKVKSLKAAKLRNNGIKNIQKFNLNTVQDVYENLTQDANDELDFDTDLYDYAFSGDTLESDDLLENLATPQTKKTGFTSILEYLNGNRQEVPWTYLFEPTQNELTLVHAEGAEPEIISIEQLSCIHLSKLPAGFPRNKDETCHVEIIETFDGNIFHEFIHPEQSQANVLFGFSTKTDTLFKYTLIPRHNIKKRFQRRHLGQILLDKNLISDVALKNVLVEHKELKTIKFGRILAAHAKILYSAVESEIQKAYENPQQQLKIGEILLKAGLVNEEQILAALTQQKKLQNRKLGNFLIEKGILQEKDVCLALAEKFRIPFVDLRQQKGSKKVLSLLPRELILKLKVLPLSLKEGTLVVATLLPEPSTICEVILKHSPVKDVEFVLAQPSHLKNVINMLFQVKK